MTDLGPMLERALQPSLAEGEVLRGSCVATRQSAFRGWMVAVGVTERRLLLQRMTRRWEPDGEADSLPPERIASAKAEGAGGGWINVTAAVMDGAAVTLKLRTTDGEKIKLMMMRGDGPLGGLGGGEAQRRGVEALAQWFAQAADG